MFGSKNRRIAALEAQVVSLAKSLKAEIATRDALDRTAKKYRQERDSYREDALKHRRSRANLKQFRTPTNGAQATEQARA